LAKFDPETAFGLGF